MDITKLSDSELADMTANLVTLLAGTELSAIEGNVRAELIAGFGTRAAGFIVEISAAAAADDGKKAAFSVKDLTRAYLIGMTRRTNFALKAGGATKEQFDLARFDYPAPRVNAYIAQIPSDMAATGYSNGINRGRFQGNNRSTSVMYDIWRREGDSGAWHSHILTRRQSFEDEGVTPGQYYEYRVRALAARNTSGFSNSTVVYGVL